MRQIDLNCDLGEGFGVYKLVDDITLLPYISSANIACGFHAGDPNIMRSMVRHCLEYGVAIGAHPGLLDPIGFGRREMAISPEDAAAAVVYQIGALSAIARVEGGELHHVKLHGALYNMAVKNKELAMRINEAIYQLNSQLKIYTLANSEMARTAVGIGLSVVPEVFADRTLASDGSLMPRSSAGAVIERADEALKQVRSYVHQRGENPPQTICVHGDGPLALQMLQTLHEALSQEGITITVPR